MQQCHALTCFSVIYSLTSSPAAYILKSAFPLPKKKKKIVNEIFLNCKIWTSF